ncbi:MAG: hypothetical protein KME42_10060 [Tildeniella nuda ZEHNDER 1965/U140]|nr:hypothetical protein [Tildeniella nuda ZEHNDER 1965/U140]
MTATLTRRSLEDVVGQILLSGEITSHSRYQLMQTILAEGLSESECILLDRLLYGVRKGLLLLVD